MESFDRWPLLAKTQSPEALRALPADQLAPLAEQIRDYLVFRTEENGGHLASNLGVVELTMAIHRVFDTPQDRVIFDVGHQCYVHKLLTGRGAQFDTLRLAGGLSGFTKRAESEYDPFGAGHSSTAISAAIGMAEADRLAGRDTYTVAVVGDGALTGGLAFEALNNCHPELKLVIVINENEMSISPNTGRLAEALSRMRTSRGYIRTKEIFSRIVRGIPLIGGPLYRGIRRLKRRIKHAVYRENMFEHMGIRYLGPINGNDMAGTEQMLRHARQLGCSVILHAKTVKGKGYAKAECDAPTYHALPPRNKAANGATFSSIMGHTLCRMASEDERLVAITAAMRDGTGLAPFAEQYPTRFFDVGIAEGHAVTFAAGLAASGLRPVVAVYSTFLQRAFDHIVHDVALQGLPLLLCIDRAGLNASDGPTHHGIFDVAMLAALPNVRIFAPVSEAGLVIAMREAAKHNGIAAIRYPAGAPDARVEQAFYSAPPERCGVRVCDKGEHIALTILTYGRIAVEALEAAEILAKRDVGVRVLLCEYLAPFGTLCEEIIPLLAGDTLLFLSEEVRVGSFGMCLSAELRHRGDTRVHVDLATENPFLSPATGQTPTQAAGLDAASIIKRVLHAKGEKRC